MFRQDIALQTLSYSETELWVLTYWSGLRQLLISSFLSTNKWRAKPFHFILLERWRSTTTPEELSLTVGLKFIEVEQNRHSRSSRFGSRILWVFVTTHFLLFFLCTYVVRFDYIRQTSLLVPTGTSTSTTATLTSSRVPSEDKIKKLTDDQCVTQVEHF